jgi:hypothetical protein
LTLSLAEGKHLVDFGGGICRNPPFRKIFEALRNLLQRISLRNEHY